MDDNVPHDVKDLCVRMWQNDVGITESVTPLEIKYALGETEFREPIETVLQSMVVNGLVEVHREVVCNRNSSDGELRLVRSYRLSPNSLERLL